ncbi:MAG: hypothetical protein F6K40_38490 [Okeania sp. SIO3I5]|uniref:hypothetical protein n=1 Tax=Okeania sp. SIO3I5 TaxID=2607805 RepID=UPI0013BCA9BC|nr:hypothetical protein [Okeania sp. SIO3I5]NEQ41760.1 hypothetical protein [Okeania sp. SIO3I5]
MNQPKFEKSTDGEFAISRFSTPSIKSFPEEPIFTISRFSSVSIKNFPEEPIFALALPLKKSSQRKI